MLGHTLRRPETTPGNQVMIQYFQRKIMNSDIARKTTNRGRVLTTLPRLLQRDIMEKLTTPRQRKDLCYRQPQDGDLPSNATIHEKKNVTSGEKT